MSLMKCSVPLGSCKMAFRFMISAHTLCTVGNSRLNSCKYRSSISIILLLHPYVS